MVTDPASWPRRRRNKGEKTAPIGARGRGSSVLRESLLSGRVKRRRNSSQKTNPGALPMPEFKGAGERLSAARGWETGDRMGRKWGAEPDGD